jgi:transposase-like protein
MDKKRFETIQLVEGRRNWPAEEKARIMEEALEPGASGCKRRPATFK